MLKKIAFWAMVFVLISGPSLFAAEPFPTREIEIIVPWEAGGGMDLMARTLAPGMSEILGKPVVAINKPGAAGTLGTTLTCKRKPDGYILMTISPSPILFSPHIQKLEYHPLKDITYIAGLLMQPYAIVVQADAPWKTFQELLDDAKKNPGKIKYGHHGPNSYDHVLMENVAKDRGVNWVGVPYKGDGALGPAILGGHVPVAGIAMAWVPHARAGRLRPLVLLTERRIKEFPELPILNEFGFNYYLGGASLNGIGAPKGIPEEVLQKIEDSIRRAADTPKFKEAAKTVSHELFYQNGKEFTKSVEDGFNSIGDMIKKIAN